MTSYFVTISGKEYTVEIGQNNDILVNGETKSIDIKKIDGLSYILTEDDTFRNIVADKNETGYQIFLNGHLIEATVETERNRYLRQYEQATSTGPKKTEIKSPMPALVVKIEVEVGDEVTVGQGLVVLEAMKMENEIKSHTQARVKAIYAKPGSPVEKGELLIVLE